MDHTHKNIRILTLRNLHHRIDFYIIQNNVPEPFTGTDSGNNIKEGLPEGLGGQQRWGMGDRIDHDRIYK